MRLLFKRYQLAVAFLLSAQLFFTKIAHAQAEPSATYVVVAKDGTGNFKTIQAAINNVRDLAQIQVVIFIKKGTYQEKLSIPAWKTHISLVGEDRDSTIIVNNDYSGKVNAGNTDIYGNAKFSTYTSYTVLVQGNDFRAENLTIKNGAGRVGQAVALHIEADRVVIKHCNLLGNQDTLYAAKENSRQYFEECYIAGTTDFIFGEAIAVFTRCTINSLINSFITAASTRQGQKFGYVFFDCKLIADTAAKKVFLGRPWRSYAKTVFIHCELGNHIVPEGWNAWPGDAMFPNKEKTAYYAEFENTGAGSPVTNRVKWSHQLTKKEFRQYKLANIFSGWIPV